MQNVKQNEFSDGTKETDIGGAEVTCLLMQYNK